MQKHTPFARGVQHNVSGYSPRQSYQLWLWLIGDGYFLRWFFIKNIVANSPSYIFQLYTDSTSQLTLIQTWAPWSSRTGCLCRLLVVRQSPRCAKSVGLFVIGTCQDTDTDIDIVCTCIQMYMYYVETKINIYIWLYVCVNVCAIFIYIYVYNLVYIYIYNLVIPSVCSMCILIKTHISVCTGTSLFSGGSQRQSATRDPAAEPPRASHSVSWSLAGWSLGLVEMAAEARWVGLSKLYASYLIDISIWLSIIHSRCHLYPFFQI